MASQACTSGTAAAPSPEAAATRFIESTRMSPAAKIPGTVGTTSCTFTTLSTLTPSSPHRSFNFKFPTLGPAKEYTVTRTSTNCTV